MNMIFISSREATKMYISFVASHFGICMNSLAYKCTSSGTFLGIPKNLSFIFWTRKSIGTIEKLSI